MISRMRKLIGVACALVMSSSVFAGMLDDNSCQEFGIQVLNRTGSDCIFQSYRMLKGYLVNITPNQPVLPAYGIQVFTTRQNLVSGPTIVLDYQCGGQRISLESHQNYCLLAAGSVRGEVLSSDRGVRANSNRIEGSHYYSYPGHIYWALESRD